MNEYMNYNDTVSNIRIVYYIVFSSIKNADFDQWNRSLIFKSLYQNCLLDTTVLFF